MKAREVLKLLTPPIIPMVLRKIKGRGVEPEWEFIPEGWAAAENVQGWNVPSVLEAYRSRWPDFIINLQGPRPFGGGANATLESHNVVVSFAYAITLASRNKSKISMLDWGGGLGHYYLIARAALPDEIEVFYTCKDVPILCEHGRKLFPDALFYDDDSYLNQKYDFALVSGSLQYVKDWRETLQKIAGVTDGYMFVTRLPIVRKVPSFVVLQRAYDTAYLGWVFNRDEFLQCASDIGLELVREFLIHGKVRAYRAPEEFDFRGFLYRVSRSDNHRKQKMQETRVATSNCLQE